jgi:hypothetical protein
VTAASTVKGWLGGVGCGKGLYFMEGVFGVSATQCCTFSIAIVLRIKLAAMEYFRTFIFGLQFYCSGIFLREQLVP